MSGTRDPAEELRRLLEVMAALRHPESGCPWDKEQSFATIAPFTIEEAYEVADAIARHDLTALQDELGDLLLQVVYHARMAEEDARFDFADVAHAIATKMIERHPHVFSQGDAVTTDELHVLWERRKAADRAQKARAGRGDTSLLADIPAALPALTRASKLQKRAARVAFDWADAKGALAKVGEEIEELLDAPDPAGREAEFGDILFTLVNIARHLGVDPETSLRGTNHRFEARFRQMEADATRSGQDLARLSADAREALWEKAKRELG